MRVAVTQFATSLTTEENLATCIRVINKVTSCDPDIIVLPSFYNSFADEQANQNKDAFFKPLAEQAKQHSCYIVAHFNALPQLNSVLHSSPTLHSRLEINPVVEADKAKPTSFSCVFSPEGALIHSLSEAVTTPIGNLGLLANDDVLTFEAARGLALGGAQLLCYSDNSFSLDNGNLHAPARACENKVFLAVSNTVGQLFDEEALAENIIPEQNLAGVGQSQIISPNGEVLAKLDHSEEGFIFADITLTANNKCRPDGTDIIEQCRPDLYKQLNNASKNNNTLTVEDNNRAPQTANVALFATYKVDEQALEDVCFYIENNLSDIIQLPELFFIADKNITHDVHQLARIEELSQQVITLVSAELRPFQYVCTSLVLEGIHQAVIISQQGVFATQQQLHFCERYSWTELGNELTIVSLPLDQGSIKLVMLTADDANIPELVDIAVSQNIHTLLLPIDIQEPSEVDYSLLSKAIEHRVCIVAATREKSFPVSNNKVSNKASGNKVKTKKSTGLVADLKTQNELLTHLHSRKFSGYINQPIVKYQFGKITKSLIHPRATYEKGLKLR